MACITVTEESLTKCVSEVRQALGDTGQRIIKTVPKRGYIFAVPVNSKHLGERGAIEPSITVQPYAPIQTDTTSDHLPVAGRCLCRRSAVREPER